MHLVSITTGPASPQHKKIQIRVTLPIIKACGTTSQLRPAGFGCQQYNWLQLSALSPLACTLPGKWLSSRPAPLHKIMSPQAMARSSPHHRHCGAAARLHPRRIAAAAPAALPHCSATHAPAHSRVSPPPGGFHGPAASHCTTAAACPAPTPRCCSATPPPGHLHHRLAQSPSSRSPRAHPRPPPQVGSKDLMRPPFGDQGSCQAVGCFMPAGPLCMHASGHGSGSKSTTPLQQLRRACRRCTSLAPPRPPSPSRRCRLSPAGDLCTPHAAGSAPRLHGCRADGESQEVDAPTARPPPAAQVGLHHTEHHGRPLDAGAATVRLIPTPARPTRTWPRSAQLLLQCVLMLQRHGHPAPCVSPG